MRTRVVLLLLFVLSNFLPAEAQTDTAFWFAAPHVIGGDRRDTPIYIRVMPVATAATIKVYCPANPSFTPITTTVAAGSVSSIRLTDFKSMLVDSVSNTILNRGIKIEASQMITAYYDESSERNPEIYALKGVNSLGSAFYIPGQRWRFNNTADNGTRKAYNAFDVVATEDNTVITITPSRAIDGHAANVAFTVTLNKGQTYCCRATGQTVDDHLGSSTVISTKPIAVTVVDDFVNLGGCSDAGEDQLVPVSIFGTEYAAVNGYITDDPYDRICVMATEDNTKVYLAGSATVWKTLSKGQSEEYPFTGAPVYIKSDKPVSVMHVSGIGCELSYAVLPPLGACIGSKVVGIVRPGSYDCYLMLLVPVTTGIESSFSITSTAGTTAIAASYFGSITGTSAWKYARVPLGTDIYPSGSFGKITSSQNVKFHAGIIYGKSGVGGSYGYFSNYAISPTVTPPNDTVFCNGTYTGDLKFTSTVNNSVFEWVNDNTTIGLGSGGTGNIPSFLAVNPTDTIQYAHVSVVPKANDCDGIPRQFTIVVHPTPKLKVAATPKPVCVPATVNITADSITAGSTTGMTLYYYTNRTVTTTVANPKKISFSGWYYIQGKSAAGCLSNIDSVKVTINDTPKVVITNPAAVCVGETVDITKPAIVAGSTAGITFGYYTDPTSGVQYATPTAAPLGTYYIIGTNANGCSSTPMPVKITEKVNATAADLTLTPDSVCIGTKATLQASSTLANPVFNWYSDTTLSTLVGTGASFVTGILNANTTYFVTVSGDTKCANKANQGGRVVALVKRYATEADITTKPDTICYGATPSLTVSSSMSSPTFTWYRSRDLSSPAGTGATFSDGALTASTTYYVTVSNKLTCSNQAGTADSVIVTVKPYALATDITAGDASICYNNAATLTASSSTLNTPPLIFKWYSDNTLSTLVNTGATYTTPNLTAGKTYYVTVSNAEKCANSVSEAKPVKVYVNQLAAAADVVPKAADVCIGTSAIVTASSTTVTAPVFTWYTNSALTTKLSNGTGTGDTVTTPVLNANTTYYVTVSGSNACENKSAAVAITVKVKSYAANANITINGASVCSGTSTTLTATSSLTSPAFTWYGDAALSTVVGTGASYTTSKLVTDSTYYITVSNATLCANTAATAKSVTVAVKPYATAADITTTNDSVCNGASVKLTVSSTTLTGTTFSWYSDSTLNNLLTTGTSYNTPNLSANITYYLTVSNTAKCANKQAGRDSVVVTIKRNAVATDIIAVGDSICPNTSTILKASSSLTTPVYTWYSDASLSSGSLLYTGANYTTASISASKTYYVTVSGVEKCANTSSDVKTVNVVVNRVSVAADVVATAADICKGSNAKLIATSTLSHPTFTWYTGANLTGKLGTGDSIVVNAVNATTTYYVTVSNDSVCSSTTTATNSVAVKVKEYAKATDISASDRNICYNNSVVLTASSTMADAVFTWYKDAGLTQLLTSGANYTTDLLLATQTYYVSVASSTLCANQANTGKAVKVTVQPYATAANISVRDTAICVGSQVTLSASSTLASATMKWYRDKDLTDSVGVGTQYTTKIIEADSIYYVSVSNANTCSNVANTGAVVNVKVKSYALATDITVDSAAVCKGSSAKLTATSSLSGAKFLWYSNAGLTAQVSNTNTYTTAALSADATYYVTVSGNDKCANKLADAVPVTVKVKEYAIGSDISVTYDTICYGGTAELKASSELLTNAVFKWYKGATVTSADSVGVGSSYTVSGLTADATYYVTVSSNEKCANLSGKATPVKVKVNKYATASDIVISNVSVCPGEQASLTAKSTTLASPLFKWYSDSRLQTLVGEGATYTTAALQADSTYYIAISNVDRCYNLAETGKPVTVTVKRFATAADITLTAADVCANTAATIYATSSTLPSATFTWYRDAGLTNYITTGASYQTPALGDDSTYYVSVSNVTACNNEANKGASIIVKVKSYATAADITVAPDTICTGATAKLVASSTLLDPVTATFTWYKDASLSSASKLATGSSYTTPALTASTTYYVSVSNADYCNNEKDNGAGVTVKVNTYAVASDIKTIPDTICTGSAAVVEAKSDLTGTLFTWYSDAALANKLGTGDTYTTPVLIANATYYVSVNNADKCDNKSGQGQSVVVKVNKYATPANVSATADAICSGTKAVVKASSALASPTFKWYSDAALTHLIGEGAMYTTAVLTSDSTYYVSVSNVDMCSNEPNNGAVVTVKVKEYATTADVRVVTDTVCFGQKAKLVASSTLAGPTFTWYSDAGLTTSVATGAIFTTPALNSSTTYYVSVSNVDKCNNEATAAVSALVKVNEFATAADIATITDTICTGTTAVISASSSLDHPTFTWYSDANLSHSLATGDSYTTPVLNANTTYYVSVSNVDKCNNLAQTGATATMKVNTYAVAADIKAITDTVCTGSAATLTASSTLVSPIFTWYSDAALTAVVGSDATFTTPALNGSTTYYVSVSNVDKCNNQAGTGATVAVKVNVYATAADVVAVTDTVCTGTKATLQAGSTLSNPTFNWCRDEDLTDLAATGATFITPALTSGTTYYLSVNNVDKCNNLAKTGLPVVVKVNEYATTANVSVVTDTICTGSKAVLTASSILGNPVFTWYTDAALHNAVATGAIYTTPVLTSGTTYYVSVSNVDKCNNEANNGATAVVKVNTFATSADVSVKADTICKATTATLTAASSLANPTFTWYTDATLTQVAGVGATFITPALLTHTIYYVSVSNVDKCNNKANAGVYAVVKVNDYATAADVTVLPDSICTGTTAVLTAKSRLSGAGFKWYSDAAFTNLVGTGATFTTPVLTAGTAYYVSVSNDEKCYNQPNTGGVAQVYVKAYATGVNVSAADTTVCAGTSAALTATSTGVLHPVYSWYVQAGGQALQTSSNAVYNTGNITAATTYYVTVKGDNLCENLAATAKPVVVSVKTLPVITTQPKGVSSICENRATGFSLVATGDNVKYQWQVNDNKGGGYVDIAGATTFSLTLPLVTLDMSGYQYRCIVRNDCGEAISSAIVLTVNAAPKITSDPKDATVCEKGTASFSITASGAGNITYMWQLDRKDGLGFIAISGATAATYTITGVTEAMSGYAYRCIVTGTCAPADTSKAGVLTVPVARIGDIGTHRLCNDEVTSAVPLQSSVAGTSYTWVNTNTKIGLAASGTGTISSFTAINRGEHPDSAMVTVTPVAYGCTGVAKSFMIVVNPSPILSSAATDRICSGNAFNYTATSETQGTSFTWTRAVVAGVSNTAASGTGNISEIFTNSTTAAVEVVYNYTLVANSCSFTQPVKLTVKPVPVAAISGDTACAQSTVVLSGSANLTGSTFAWTTPAGKTAAGSTLTLAGVQVSEGGVYTLIATKDYCASAPVTYKLVVKPLPTLTVAGDTGVCIGQKIALSASSDIGVDQYTWSGPSGFTTHQPAFTINNVALADAGNYNLVAEKDGCVSNTKVVTVVVNTYPTVSIQRSSIACENASVWVKAISNLPLSTYIWQGPGVSGTGQEMVIKPVTGTTLKIYVVVSKSGCAIKDSVEFAVKKSPAVDMPEVPNVCQSVSPFKITASETTGMAGSGAFSGASVTTDGLFNPSIAAGTYIITYKYTSTEGCSDEKSVAFKVYPMPGVSAGADKTMYAGGSVRLDGIINGNYVSYNWSLPGDTALNYTTLTPTVSPEWNTTYILSAVNSYGCKAVDSVDVTVMRFRIPNSFSPNGDGINDNWNIPGLSKYPNSRLEIYNRWGTRLFLSKGNVTQWDGRYNGAYVPAATYYYIIYLNDGESANEKPIAGWVEVMR